MKNDLVYLNYDKNLFINRVSYGVSLPNSSVVSLWEWGNVEQKKCFVSIVLSSGERKDFFSEERYNVIELADKFLQNIL